jgi:hypothetical protein
MLSGWIVGQPRTLANFCRFEPEAGFSTGPPENVAGRRNCSFSSVQRLEQTRVYHPDFGSRHLRRKMSTKLIQTEPMTKVFKHWQNLAIGAILLALNVYLVTAASTLISDPTTAIQGWAVFIVGGYAFIAALYLATTTISEHSPLPQVLPGILDNSKLFIVGAVIYAIGYFLISNGAILPTNQIIAQVLALIVGAGLVLVSAIVAISAALTRLNK